MKSPILRVDNAVVRYGTVTAVDGVSLEVGMGESVALLGANGAGKTSLATSISGLVRVASGRIFFSGEDISRSKPHVIARAGLNHVPEGRGVLHDLTVHENLRLGGVASNGRGSTGDEQLDRVLGLFPRLKERWKQRAGSLSGGEQQMLVLARALLADPQLLVLDEPSIGLAPQLVRETFALIEGLAASGLSILIVEQNLAHTLRLVDRAYVMSNGRIVMEGTSDELRDDPRLTAAYLGGDVE